MKSNLNIPKKVTSRKSTSGCRSFRLGEVILIRMEKYRHVNWSEFVRNQIVAAMDQIDADCSTEK